MTDRGQQPTLQGRRVRLRPWRPYEVEHAQGFVGEIASSTWADGGGLFAVEPAGGGPLIASIGVFPPRDGFGERAGYRTEGLVRQRFLDRGRPGDFVLYALLASDARSEA